jgi:protein SCO1/2
MYVADFFFTRCPGICPKMSTELTRVQEVFSKDEEIKILSFSVDPDYDQPDTLKKYSTKYSADLAQWTFVTGTKDSIYALAQKGFFLSAMEDAARPVEFIHSDKMVLVDRNGWIRGYYSGTDKKDVDRLIDEIRVLKNIYKNQ